MLGIDTSGDPLGSLELERFHPVVRVRRTIDPALLALNGRGALNGHIPITAIVMSVAVVVAALVGAGEVVMANERDASLPTRVVDGEPVNHQYSKSWDFERRFDAAVRAEIGGIDVYSLLRPVPEALIFGRVATMTDLLPRLSSCNRVRTRGGGSASGIRLVQRVPEVRVLVPRPRRPPATRRAGADLRSQPARRSVRCWTSSPACSSSTAPCDRSSASANPTTPARCCAAAARSRAWADAVVCRPFGDRVGAAVAPRVGGPNHVPADVWPALLTLDDPSLSP